MGRLSSSCYSYSEFILLPLLLLFHTCFEHATCGKIVQFLPGIEGPLPFVLETGYVGVGEGKNVQAFYYFIESENNPKEDPLMLWLTGGPGCSCLHGLMFEIGPFTVKKEEYNGSRPNLILNPHSWTKVSSIIFIDIPVSTGFTYAKTKSAAQRGDWLLVRQTRQFLRKWLINHPKFLSNKVYIGGDSYSGIPIPVIVQEISQENEKGLRPRINLQGYILGNALTTERDTNYAIPFSHGMGLISDELYESLQKNCKREYVNVDPRDVFCLRDMNSFMELTSGLDLFYILEPACYWNWIDEGVSWRRYLINKYPPEEINGRPPLYCRSYEHFLANFWVNDDNVRKALHIRKGSIGKWHRCSFDIPYKKEINSSFEYHVNLSKKGYRSLIYSGDHDMMVSFFATQAWIRYLNYSIVNDWRPWHDANGRVAGYTRTYSNRMTFATVKGGGHTAPEHKPEECFAMYSRWISNMTLWDTTK
ncbi:serine carboxypeptidase-like 11 [Lotus japonicus]|uniref:serine carboxypeptidase-like 11 n=1 Tax=Lotus japonicus TaxID=34305 RepID=UPI00258C3957|nr:serine carboxypeptidase-like 11 [Lotus japonicus]